MRDYFDYGQYWNRNASEYNNSSLKRRFGDFVRSVKFRAQHSEVTARIVLHNLKAILARLFHQSRKRLMSVSLRYLTSSSCGSHRIHHPIGRIHRDILDPIPFLFQERL